MKWGSALGMPANCGSLPSTGWPTFPNNHPNIPIKPVRNITRASRVVKFCSLESGLVQKSRREHVRSSGVSSRAPWALEKPTEYGNNQFSLSIAAGCAGGSSESDGEEVGFRSSANPRVGIDASVSQMSGRYITFSIFVELAVIIGDSVKCK